MKSLALSFGIAKSKGIVIYKSYLASESVNINLILSFIAEYLLNSDDSKLSPNSAKDNFDFLIGQIQFEIHIGPC